MRVRVSAEFQTSFDQQVRRICAEIGEAAREGPVEVASVLDGLNARLRQLFNAENFAIRFNQEDLLAYLMDRLHKLRKQEALQPVSSEQSVLATTSTADGLPVTVRRGRPAGPIYPSVLPEFTALRKQLGLSREEISARAAAAGLQISKSTIGNLELGAVIPQRDHAVALAAGLGLPFTELLPLLRLASGHVVEV